MARVFYEVVEHDGGWAYKVQDVFSEPFPTKDLAVEAAKRAAAEQQVSGEATDIEFEDKRGHWHREFSSGQDRPEAKVKE